MAKLTPKQKRFVDEYLIDLNATQAAIRAGYSEKTANVIGCENLMKPNIQSYIRERQQMMEKRTEITQDRVLKEYAKIAFLDPRNFFYENGKPKAITDLDGDTAAALAGMDVLEEFEGFGEERTFIGYTKKYKIADKIKALDSIAKHLGMFTDKVEQTVSGGVRITVDYGDEDDE
jgi:phage terminase small subunit